MSIKETIYYGSNPHAYVAERAAVKAGRVQSDYLLAPCHGPTIAPLTPRIPLCILPF